MKRTLRTKRPPRLFSAPEKIPAFFLRVLIMQRPGRVNLPAFFTSLVPISARLSKTFVMVTLLQSSRLSQLRSEGTLAHNLCRLHGLHRSLGFHRLRSHDFWPLKKRKPFTRGVGSQTQAALSQQIYQYKVQYKHFAHFFTKDRSIHTTNLLLSWNLLDDCKTHFHPIVHACHLVHGHIQSFSVVPLAHYRSILMSIPYMLAS